MDTFGSGQNSPDSVPSKLRGSSMLLFGLLISGLVFGQGVAPPLPTPGPPPIPPPPGSAIQPAPGAVTVLAGSPADTNFQEEYGRIVNGGEAVKALDLGQFGEKVDLATGATSFEATDVSLPGNNAIPVAIGRTRVIEIRGGNFQRAFGDWDMDIPYMEGVFVQGEGWVVGLTPPQDQQRCSGPQSPYQMTPPFVTTPTGSEGPEVYWQGIHLHAPGQGRQEVLYVPADPLGSPPRPVPTDGLNYKYVTSGQWYLSCDGGLPNGQLGDGYIARSPDGLVYHFNHMVTEPYSALLRPAALGVNVTLYRERNRLYPTLVTDRYGNSVTYSWSGSKLTTITSSDGRSLTVGYNGSGMISTVFDGTRTWSYGYSSSPTNWLTSVTLPDSSQWTYDFSPIGIGVVSYSATGNETLDYDKSLNCNWMKTLLSNLNQHSITIKHPSGATGTFGFDVKRFGRARVYYACNETVRNDERTHFPSNPARFDTWSITQKTVSGAGISTPYTWSYTYNSPVGSFADHGCDRTQSCPLTKTIDVVAPDGSKTTSTYGIEYGVSDTQLQKVEIFPSGSSTPLRTTTYQYGDTSTASGQYVFTIGMTPQWYLSDSYLAEWVRPQRYRSIVQDGVTFTNIVNAFDTYARPISVSKSSALGSKTEINTYNNNTNKWVVSQPNTMTVAGTLVSQTDYDPTYAYPTAVYQFGKKQYDLGYFTSGPSIGNVNTVTDGNNRTTTYSDYYRGIAQRVDFADGQYQSATVSPLGLITSIRKEAGFTTNYAYTTDGRLQTITYPTGDNTSWNTRNFVFEQVPPSDYYEYGIGPGHWRQTISTGMPAQ